MSLLSAFCVPFFVSVDGPFSHPWGALTLLCDVVLFCLFVCLFVCLFSCFVSFASSFRYNLSNSAEKNKNYKQIYTLAILYFCTFAPSACLGLVDCSREGHKGVWQVRLFLKQVVLR